MGSYANPYVPARPEFISDVPVVEINGSVLYDFDKKKGLLKVAMPPEDLELWKKRFGEIPKEGGDLTLPAPFFNGDRVVFKGVKRVESTYGNYVMFMPRSPRGWDFMEGLLGKIFS